MILNKFENASKGLLFTALKQVVGPDLVLDPSQTHTHARSYIDFQFVIEVGDLTITAHAQHIRGEDGLTYSGAWVGESDSAYWEFDSSLNRDDVVSNIENKASLAELSTYIKFLATNVIPSSPTWLACDEDHPKHDLKRRGLTYGPRLKDYAVIDPSWELWRLLNYKWVR